MKLDGDKIWYFNKIFIVLLFDILALFCTVVVSVAFGSIIGENVSELYGLMTGAWFFLCGSAARSWLNTLLVEKLLINKSK